MLLCSSSMFTYEVGRASGRNDWQVDLPLGCDERQDGMTGAVFEHIPHRFEGVECMWIWDELSDVCKKSACLVLNGVISTSLLGAESNEEFEREQNPLVMLLLVLRCSLFAVDGGGGDTELSNTESFSPSSPSAESRGRGWLDVESVLYVSCCSPVLWICKLAVGMIGSSCTGLVSGGVVLCPDEHSFCTLNSSTHSRPDMASAVSVA